jgi:hypothetical protein
MMFTTHRIRVFFGASADGVSTRITEIEAWEQ